jgi:Methyltransferase domain
MGELGRNAERAGLGGGKYVIVGKGIEEALGEVDGLGIKEGEVDAVIAVRVLCCVGDLDGTARGLWRVLRPSGGRLVLFEHVKARGGWAGLL